jgi:hypothetical protein
VLSGWRRPLEALPLCFGARGAIELELDALLRLTARTFDDGGGRR